MHTGATVSHQLMTACTYANLSNKCSSQFHVLFSLQQHTTNCVQRLDMNFRTKYLVLPSRSFLLLACVTGLPKDFSLFNYLLKISDIIVQAMNALHVMDSYWKEKKG